jgi:hypothetical protein
LDCTAPFLKLVVKLALIQIRSDFSKAVLKFYGLKRSMIALLVLKLSAVKGIGGAAYTII